MVMLYMVNHRLFVLVLAEHRDQHTGSGNLDSFVIAFSDEVRNDQRQLLHDSRWNIPSVANGSLN
jgi:hypothetical protein